MERDAVLYALSTLAQTCAALAAFVGAVGLYRVQPVASQRRALIISIHASIGLRAEAREVSFASIQ
jgi:hypothetical protein